MKRWFAPRLLALHALAVVAVVGCVLMGMWQLGVYGDKHDDRAAEQRSIEPVQLLDVWGPDDAFRGDLLGTRVRFRGHLDPSDVFTAERPDGRSWLAAPVAVDGTTAELLVVLGYAAKGQRADPGVARRTFSGYLQPPESTGDLSIAHRVNVSAGDLFSGYALLDASSTSLRPVQAPDRAVSWTVGLRNLAYALQWWIFGAFAAFMWWRMATDAIAVDEAIQQPQVA